jgi:hypothetical protein
VTGLDVLLRVMAVEAGSLLAKDFVTYRDANSSEAGKTSQYRYMECPVAQFALCLIPSGLAHGQSRAVFIHFIRQVR